MGAKKENAKKVPPARLSPMRVGSSDHEEELRALPATFAVRTRP